MSDPGDESTQCNSGVRLHATARQGLPGALSDVYLGTRLKDPTPNVNADCHTWRWFLWNYEKHVDAESKLSKPTDKAGGRTGSDKKNPSEARAAHL